MPGTIFAIILLLVICYRAVLLLFVFFFFSFSPCEQSGALACICFALVPMAVGIAWPNPLAVFAMCISASIATTELVCISLGGKGTNTGCVGCRWVEISI